MLGLRGKPHLEKPHDHMIGQATGVALWAASAQLADVDPFAS